MGELRARRSPRLAPTLRTAYLGSAGLTALLPCAPRIRVIATAVLAPVLSVSGLDAITTVVSAP